MTKEQEIIYENTLLKTLPHLTEQEVAEIDEVYGYIRQRLNERATAEDISAELNNINIDIIRDIVEHRDNFSRGFYIIIEEDDIEEEIEGE